ncbi:hypothetical protein OROMI_000807 [Orobanche minor]
MGSRSKVQPVQPKEITVSIKVLVPCTGCWNKVHKAVKTTTGVKVFNFDEKSNKLTVTGMFNPKEVLTRVQKVKKDAVFYPVEKPKDVLKDPLSLTQSNNMAQAPPPPHAAGSGLVTNAVRFDQFILPYEKHFSDDNPNGCSIM